MAIPTSSILLVTILVAVLPYHSTADENNLLLTGEVLNTDSQLSNDAATFVIQDDCNLVLYTTGNGFVSDTHGQGLNCTLTLSDLGQLIIHRADGSIVWASTLAPNSTTGNYAAILRPDGQVAVYGASVWSVPFSSSSNTTTFSFGDLETAQPTPSAARNVLFTDQILYKDDSKLTSRDHSLVMREDCNLALERASYPDTWTSSTTGRGQDCYARLSNHGQIVISDMRGYNALWSSNSILGNEGQYALVLHITGRLAIYGPVIWSTASF